jgi:2'-5' RNA ligase
VPLEQVHLTVQFIGDVSGRDRDATVESVARATAGLAAFRLEPRRMISLPRRGAARLIAVETSSPPPLAELHRRLIQRFVREQRGRSGRSFLPHFTLARYPHESSPVRINEAIRLEPILIGEVRLMKSDLRSSGAKHTTEMSWTLSG